MAFVNEASCECEKSELELFAVQPTQTTVKEANVVEYLPVSSIQNRTPLYFHMSGAGNHYIDMANVMLYVCTKIMQGNNANLAADTTVAPVNLMLYSVFSLVGISRNGTQISSLTNTYLYRAMFEMLLSDRMDAKKSRLSSKLYYRDSPGSMEPTTIVAADGAMTNEGLQSRRTCALQSHEFEIIGCICGDISQECYLLNEVGIKLRLARSKDTFCLMGAPLISKLHITHTALFM